MKRKNSRENNLMFVPRARVTTTVNSKKNMGNNIQFDIASTQKKNVCIKKINNR